MSIEIQEDKLPDPEMKIKEESSALMTSEWKKIIKSGKLSSETVKKLEQMIFNGVPCFLRYKIYSLILERDIKIDYQKYKNMSSSYDHQIDVDVQRTFRNHVLFKEKYGAGQCRLFNVLISYSNYNPIIGYCQGMSSIVAILLMYFTEEEAFNVFIKLIKKNKLEKLFDKNLSKLDLILQTQKMVFINLIPEIDLHFEKENIDCSLYSTSWYLTLFTRFKLKLALRIWDIFVFYDFSILIYLSASILKYYEIELLSLRGENLIEFISKIESSDIDAEKLFRILKRMTKWEDIDKVRLILGLKETD